MPSIDEMLALNDATEGDIRTCAERLRDALVARAALDDIIANLQMELPARMESESVAVAGVGVLRKQRYTTSAWRDERASADFRTTVGQLAVDRIALDVATGELDPVRRNIGRAVVDKLWEYVPSFSTVKIAAKRDGISMDDYRTESTITKVTLDLLEDAPWR